MNLSLSLPQFLAARRTLSHPLEDVGSSVIAGWRSDSVSIPGVGDDFYDPTYPGSVLYIYEAIAGETTNLQLSQESNAQNRPIHGTGGQNGLSYCEFLGSGRGGIGVPVARWDTHVGGAITQPFSVLTIMDVTSTSTNDHFYDGAQSNARGNLYVRGDSKYTMWSGGTEATFGVNVSTGFQWFGQVFNGTSSVLYRNGVKQTLSANPGTYSMQGFILGERYDFGNRAPNCKWYESIVFNGAVTDGEWEGVVTNYLSDYYAYPS